MTSFFGIPFACVLAAFAAVDPPSAMASAPDAEGWPSTRTLDRPIASIGEPMLGELRTLTIRNLLNGKVERLDVAPFGNGIRVSEPNGCVWTRSFDWFAPSDSFAGCGTSSNWHTAQASVQRYGSLFPLRVGNQVRYQRNAVSWNGRTSSRQTVCEVTGTEEVMRPGGRATPAYVVTCDDGRVTRTTWYAPQEGPIAYHEERQGRGVRDAWMRID